MSHLSIRLSSILILIGTVGLVSACDDSADSPSSLVLQPRILAMQAQPPVISIGEETIVVPLIADVGASSNIQLSMRVCNPWRVISDPTSDCDASDSLPLKRETFEQGDGARLNSTAVLEAFPPPSWWQPSETGEPGASEEDGENDCPDVYEFLDVVVVAEALIDDSVRLLATKRVRVTEEPVLRQNPVVQDLMLDDRLSPNTFVPDREYTLLSAPRQDSLDRVCDDNDVQLLETVRVYIYASAGRVADPYIDIEYTAEDQEMVDMTIWTAPSEGNASLWLVAIDGDGGVGWKRFDLNPNP